MPTTLNHLTGIRIYIHILYIHTYVLNINQNIVVTIFGMWQVVEEKT